LVGTDGVARDFSGCYPPAMKVSIALAALPLALLACRPSPPTSTEIGWQKGETHLHSANSPDSKMPPDEVARWYESHGFDFIVFTDHDFVTALPSSERMLVIPGAELTQNLKACDPPPDGPKGCALHVNALFASRPGPVVLPPAASPSRVDLYQRSLDAARELDAIPQLNHPTFAHAADGALVTELARRGLALIEVANQGHAASNAGDAQHPSAEALWDQALTAGATLWGVASDDAHQYSDAEAAAVVAQGGEAYRPGRGWIMVHARKEPGAIRAAIARGDFYASTGVTLSRVEHDGDALEIDGSGGLLHFVFIGAGGRELARSDGENARFPLAMVKGGYVRAVITDGAGHHAWTQPVRVPPVIPSTSPG
jgi:hypothetical protein